MLNRNNYWVISKDIMVFKHFYMLDLLWTSKQSSVGGSTGVRFYHLYFRDEETEGEWLTQSHKPGSWRKEQSGSFVLSGWGLSWHSCDAVMCQHQVNVAPGCEGDSVDPWTQWKKLLISIWQWQICPSCLDSWVTKPWKEVKLTDPSGNEVFDLISFRLYLIQRTMV